MEKIMMTTMMMMNLIGVIIIMVVIETMIIARDNDDNNSFTKLDKIFSGDVTAYTLRTQCKQRDIRKNLSEKNVNTAQKN